MINTSYINDKNFSFMGKNNLKTNHSKKIILEESLDEFVSNIIKKERESSGEIYNYKQNLSSKDLKKYKSELKGSVRTFILNDNLHIIKPGELLGNFIDVIKNILR